MLNTTERHLDAFQIPQVILDKQLQLNALVEENPTRIPVKKAAEFIGIHEDTLREMIDEGRCWFALGMQKSKYRNRFAHISPFTFYMWATQCFAWHMTLKDEENGFMQKGA